jgi:transcriptional regulator with XRE-family HTH domain
MSKAPYRTSAPPETLAHWLHRRRAERGLPLREVAGAAEMDISLVAKLEKGERLPTEAQILALARFFGEDPHTLLVMREAERLRREFANTPVGAEALRLVAGETRL